MTLDYHELSLSGGDSQRLYLTFTPNQVNKQVDWVSSNEGVATVSSNGTVTAMDVGECDITVTYRANTSIYDVCHVTVTSGYVCNTKTDIQQTYNDLSANSAYGTSGNNCPTIGSPKLLIIPIWFSDSSTYITSENNKINVRSDIEKVYLGSTDVTGWHSVRSYYFQESEGELAITGTVSEWYVLNNSNTTYNTSTYYANDNSSATRTKALVKEATNWYFNNHSSDSRTNYDSNHDGQLDGVMLIYGAPDYRAAGQATNNLWAYKFSCFNYSTDEPSVSSPIPNVFFWASYDFMYGSNVASSRAGSSYNGGDTSHCTLDAHTFIHEMGHVLGLDDYYDYGDTDYCIAGGFSMQDYNVGGHDPYSVMAYGWADPYIPLQSCQMTIYDFQSSHDMILLTPGTSFNSYNSVFDEYLLLELYTPTLLNKFDSDYVYSGGYPQGPSQPGIRLWHVDARLIDFDDYSITSNTNGSYYGVLHINNNTCEGERLSPYNDGHGEDWNLLQLIRNDNAVVQSEYEPLKYSDLFVEGDTFTFSDYQSQFAQSTFNNGQQCKWSFTVNSITPTFNGATATITVNRAA